MEAAAIDRALLQLGGGRQKIGDPTDFAVGFSAIRKVGERVKAKEPLLLVHARDEHTLAAVLPLLKESIEVS
jgi:pyrimidine-nucleoside phosphorylase